MPKKPTIYGGVDVPLIDFYAPPEEAYSLGLTDVKGDGEAENKVHKAISELKFLREFIKDIPLGAKVKIKDEDLQRIEDCFNNLRLAARAINKARGGQNEIHIRRPGGTIYNKLHTIKKYRTDFVEARIFGPIGSNDEFGNKSFLLNNLEKSGIKLFPKDLFMPESGHSFIIVESTGERRVLKTPSLKLKELMAGREAELTAFVAGCDVVLIEASAAGKSKFGFELFQLIAETAMNAGKEIIFSPPTDEDLLNPKTGNKKLFDKIVHYQKTLFMSMNDTEAVMSFANKGDNVSLALKNIQKILKEKLTFIKDEKNIYAPLAFVSCGADGAYAVSADEIVFASAPRIEKMIDTNGAGDGFMAGCLIKRNEICKRRGYKGRFDNAELKEILDGGQNMAVKVISKLGAQVD